MFDTRAARLIPEVPARAAKRFFLFFPHTKSRQTGQKGTNVLSRKLSDCYNQSDN